MFLFQPRSCQICLLQPSLHPQGATKKTSRLLGTMVVNNTNISRYMSFRRCPKNSEILYRVSLCRDEIHAEIRQKSTNWIFFCHGSSGLQQNWLNISTGTKFPPVHQKSQRFVGRITLGTSRLASSLLDSAVYLPSLIKGCLSLPKMPGTFIQNSWNSRRQTHFLHQLCPPTTPLPKRCGRYHPPIGKGPSNTRTYIRMKYKPQPIQGWMLSPQKNHEFWGSFFDVPGSFDVF